MGVHQCNRVIKPIVHPVFMTRDHNIYNDFCTYFSIRWKIIQQCCHFSNSVLRYSFFLAALVDSLFEKRCDSRILCKSPFNFFCRRPFRLFRAFESPITFQPKDDLDRHCTTIKLLITKTFLM